MAAKKKKDVRIKRLRKEIDELQDQLREGQESGFDNVIISDYKMRIHRLETEITALKGDSKRLKVVSERLELEKEQTVGDYSIALHERDRKIARLTEGLRNRGRRVRELKQAIIEVERNLDEYEIEAQELDAKADKYKAESEGMREELEALRGELEELRQSTEVSYVRGMQKKHAVQSQEINKLRREMEELKKVEQQPADRGSIVTGVVEEFDSKYYALRVDGTDGRILIRKTYDVEVGEEINFMAMEMSGEEAKGYVIDNGIREDGSINLDFGLAKGKAVRIFRIRRKHNPRRGGWDKKFAYAGFPTGVVKISPDSDLPQKFYIYGTNDDRNLGKVYVARPTLKQGDSERFD